MNHVILLGNLVRDPETRATSTGKSVCEFTLAVTERWKTEHGEAKERTAFVSCAIWGPRGEAFSKYHRKGSRALIQGKLAQDTWQDKETGKSRSKTRVDATEWHFVTPRHEGQEAKAAAPKAQQPQPSTLEATPEEDGPPF